MTREGERKYLGSHSPVSGKGEAGTNLPACSLFHENMLPEDSISLLGEKKGNKQNTPWVKQNKKLIPEWTLFLSSLGRAQDLTWKQVLLLCISQSTAPTCLCWGGQDLAPSLACSFPSSSSCSLPGFHTGHA